MSRQDSDGSHIWWKHAGHLLDIHLHVVGAAAAVLAHLLGHLLHQACFALPWSHHQPPHTLELLCNHTAQHSHAPRLEDCGQDTVAGGNKQQLVQALQ